MRKVGIIVSSDSCYNGENIDKSGKVIAEIMSNNNYEVEKIVILPDDYHMLVKEMKSFINNEIPLVLTTGGTGFSKRDITPEATKAVIERETPGISEAIRLKSLLITPRAMLSRATSGINNKTLIINLPGSEKAVRESLEVVLEALSHGLDILLGEKGNCGR